MLAQFADMYLAHMEKEETVIAPMAKRILDAAQIASIGAAMRIRRGNCGMSPSQASLAALRLDYSRAELSEQDAAPDPISQFALWFEQARQAGIPEPNAMSVATVAADGRPSSRIVLIKQFDADGFVWFTNYASRKGHELEHNPYAALLFHWIELERQVRIEGRVEKIAAAESDAYFESRPLPSRLGAIASQQSAPVASRELLEQRFEQVQQQYGEQPSRPAHWGGYRLRPERVEFWQGRQSRLHDRILYTQATQGGWQRTRLQP